MRALEICAGENASFSKAARSMGFETTTVDCNPACRADIIADVRTWDFKAFPPDYFDVVWASPPCQQMSICNSSKPGLETADEVSQRILEICAYFNAYAFVENPYAGGITASPPHARVQGQDENRKLLHLLGRG